MCVQSPACRRGDLPKIDGYYYPPVSGLHPSISGRVGTVAYVKTGCKFETIASQLEAEASICSIKIEQTTRHVTVHNVYYPECDGEGEWLKHHSDSHCPVVGDFNQHSVLWEDANTQTLFSLEFLFVCLFVCLSVSPKTRLEAFTFTFWLFGNTATLCVHLFLVIFIFLKHGQICKT